MTARELPILFSAPMVRALLENRKTQTRRMYYVLRRNRQSAAVSSQYPPPKGRLINGWPDTPVGYCWQISQWEGVKPGDRLWGRETWAAHWMYNDVEPGQARSADPDLRASDNRWFRADGDDAVSNNRQRPAGLIGKWRPSIHMPRWASRITLDVTEKRVESLQDISEPDAIAEGIEWNARLDPIGPCKWRHYGAPNTGVNLPVSSYRSLWEMINGAESWDANPWVVVITFKRVPQ